MYPALAATKQRAGLPLPAGATGRQAGPARRNPKDRHHRRLGHNPILKSESTAGHLLLHLPKKLDLLVQHGRLLRPHRAE